MLGYINIVVHFALFLYGFFPVRFKNNLFFMWAKILLMFRKRIQKMLTEETFHRAL